MDNESVANVIDRREWRHGPWDAEPENRLEWREHGLPCLMLRNGSGSWCGYVGVVPGHPAYDKHYNDVEVEVHGGLTYGNRCQGHICHVPLPGETDAVYWLGFDTAHSGDAVPSYDRHWEGDSYKDIAYVRREVNQLAEQLATMTPS